jgi:hypothetical protein
MEIKYLLIFLVEYKMKYKKRNPVVQALLKFKNKIIEHKKIYKRNKQKIKQQMLSHSQDI